MSKVSTYHVLTSQQTRQATLTTQCLKVKTLSLLIRATLDSTAQAFCSTILFALHRPTLSLTTAHSKIMRFTQSPRSTLTILSILRGLARAVLDLAVIRQSGRSLETRQSNVSMSSCLTLQTGASQTLPMCLLPPQMSWAWVFTMLSTQICRVSCWLSRQTRVITCCCSNLALVKLTLTPKLTLCSNTTKAYLTVTTIIQLSRLIGNGQTRSNSVLSFKASVFPRPGGYNLRICSQSHQKLSLPAQLSSVPFAT